MTLEEKFLMKLNLTNILRKDPLLISHYHV